MSGHDPAFLWETEALRTSPRREYAAPVQHRSAGLVTLVEAHNATAIPVNTLRKWARRGYVESRVADTPHGMRRLVDLDDITRHAAAVGRTIAVTGIPSPPAAVPPPVAAPPAAAPPAVAPPAAAPPAALPPADTMIVPIDAWNKMLLQLGNLHEAGQQLAEARERAAKAETEAIFLRQRLVELRTSPAEPTPDAAPPADAAPATPPQPPSPEAWWRYARRRLIERSPRR